MMSLLEVVSLPSPLILAHFPQPKLLVTLNKI